MASSAERPQSVLKWCKNTDGVLLNMLVDSPAKINRESCARGVEAEEDSYWQIGLPYVPEEKELSDSEDEVGADLEDPNPPCTGAPLLPATGHIPVTKRLFEVTPERNLKYTALCESLNFAGRNPPLSDVFEAAQLVEVLAQVSENLRKLAYNGNYKRLKIFSGLEPTPPVKRLLREPPTFFLCGQLGHISMNYNKQCEEVASAKGTSSGCDVKKLHQKRYQKRQSQCYTCGWYSHTSHSCDWGLNKESYDGYVTSFSCEVDIPEENSCGMRIVSEHSATPDKSERLGLGKHNPSGRGSIRIVSKKVPPCNSPPKLLPSNQLFSDLSTAGSETAACEDVTDACRREMKRKPHGGQRERENRELLVGPELRGSTKNINLKKIRLIQ
ncbi:hypothetical protein XELAEV_18017733mg [Xenopus laevis]|uniref:Uncharacterized protein n=1 Tax=Xenopus laevis TaxID=8355 RepID=A0A974DDW8_XENLA|nr:hypothetical protein XELAEV_18017733mg [Xenopus laevis]